MNEKEYEIREAAQNESPVLTREELEVSIAKLQKELLETWDKKAKTVSISVNGGEPIVLVLPDGDKDDFYISELGSYDYWRTSGDATKFYAFVRNLLEGKF